MTGTWGAPRSRTYPGYATPVIAVRDEHWAVAADPWDPHVGHVVEHAQGWTAHTPTNHYVGLYPDKQAAGEALVKHAGYEVLR